MSFTNNKNFLTIAKYGITALLFYYLFKQVPISEILLLLKDVKISSLIYFYLISVLLIYISCLKWKSFLGPKASKISVWKLFELYHLGYFINMFLPSFVGGDAARSWQIGKIVGNDTAFAATFLERYTGFLAMLLLGLCSIQLAEFSSPEIKIAVVGFALVFIFSTICLLKCDLEKISNLLPFVKRFSKKIAAFQIALQMGFRNYWSLGESLLLSVVFHSVTVLNTLVAAYLVAWHDAPVIDLFISLPIILIISAIPVTPNGLGLQEGAFFVILQSLGASAEQALGIALLLRAKSYFLGACGGLIYFKEIIFKTRPLAQLNKIK